ncbi:hypothetical protein [Kribbella sp. NPDC055071]
MIRSATAAIAATALVLSGDATAQAVPAEPSASARPSVVVALPSTSPSVTREYIPPGRAKVCPTAYACASVPAGDGGWYAFSFTRYATYSLYSWTGQGTAVSRQTGGAAFRWYDVNGRQLGCLRPNERKDINWSPVWSIRLTESPC